MVSRGFNYIFSAQAIDKDVFPLKSHHCGSCVTSAFTSNSVPKGIDSELLKDASYAQPNQAREANSKLDDMLGPAFTQ